MRIMHKHQNPKSLLRRFTLLIATVSCFFSFSMASASPLRIAYSDWPGWVAWDIGVQKNWFEEAGVEVDFIWFDYVASMDAFAAGQVDAVTVTNGDALVIGATGSRNIMIGINDYSNGNDMLVARRGIDTVADLKGKRVGVEVGFVAHLLLLTALEQSGLSESDVEIVNIPTHQTAQALASGDVDAITAWQPHSGQALESVSGSKALFTSADVPGIIYDTLAVSPRSLAERRDDWIKVLEVWYRIVDYVTNEETQADAIRIMAARVDLSPEEYAPFLEGTRLLTLEEALAALEPTDGLDSLYGSSSIVDAFNVANGVYDEPQNIRRFIDPTLLQSLKP